MSALDRRLPYSEDSLRRIAGAGLQDSMPRAALLSIHARVERTGPSTWPEPPLVQVWGPRYSAYVVADEDVPLFTLGRLPDSQKRRRRAVDIADRLEDALEGRKMDVREVADGLGVHPNALRYASPTGRFLIHWDGFRQPLIWSVPAPEVEPFEARLELARRFLHFFGPATSHSFSSWAGITASAATQAFEALTRGLAGVETPIGPGWILAEDEPEFRSADPAVPTRLLPSGDTYYLLQDEDRKLLIPDEQLRSRLWTSRVWPGAVLHEGAIVGTWRRSQHKVRLYPWRKLGLTDREPIELEATSLDLPGLPASIEVEWDWRSPQKQRHADDSWGN